MSFTILKYYVNTEIKRKLIQINYEKFNQYSDEVKAKAYLKRIINSIFLRIDDDFSELYSERVDLIIKELDSQYAREDELIHRYSSSKKENVEKMNKITEQLQTNRSKYRYQPQTL